MKITIVCSDPEHPVIPYLRKWVDLKSSECRTRIVHSVADAAKADLLFLVSCSEILRREDRMRFGKVLLLHASDLPKGRGWSPHVWTLLSGATKITISLIEAEDKVDTGAIYAQETVEIPKHAMFDEICDLIFSAEIRLLDIFVEAGSSLLPRPQNEEQATYFRRRSPADSEIDPQKSIEEVFDLIRVSDPRRYPAFFCLHGHRFAIELRRLPDDE